MANPDQVVSSAYVEVKLDTSKLTQQFKQLNTEVKNTAGAIDKNFIKSFNQATSAATTKMGNNVKAALKAFVIAPLAGTGAMAIKKMFDSQTAGAIQAKAKFNAYKESINSSLSTIGVWITQSKIFGKDMFEWMKKFSDLLAKVTKDDVQRFVKLLEAALIAVSGITIAIKGMKFTSGFLKTLELLGKTGVGQGAAAGLGGALGGAAGGATAILAPKIIKQMPKVRYFANGKEVPFDQGLSDRLAMFNSRRQVATNPPIIPITNLKAMTGSVAKIGSIIGLVAAAFMVLKGALSQLHIDIDLRKIASGVGKLFEILGQIPKGLEGIGVIVGAALNRLFGDKSAFANANKRLREIFGMEQLNGPTVRPDSGTSARLLYERSPAGRIEAARKGTVTSDLGSINSVTDQLERAFTDMKLAGMESLKILSVSKQKLVDEAKKTTDALRLTEISKELEIVDKDIEKANSAFERRKENIQSNLSNMDEVIRSALIGSGYKVDKNAIRDQLIKTKPEFDMTGLQLKFAESTANLANLRKVEPNVDVMSKIHAEEKNLAEVTKMIDDFSKNLNNEVEKLSGEKLNERVQQLVEGLKTSGFEEQLTKFSGWLTEAYKSIKDGNTRGKAFIDEKSNINKRETDIMRDFNRSRKEAMEDLKTEMQRSGLMGFAPNADPAKLLMAAEAINKKNQGIIEKMGVTGKTGSAQDFVRTQQDYSIEANRRQADQARKLVELFADATKESARQGITLQQTLEELKDLTRLNEKFVGATL